MTDLYWGDTFESIKKVKPSTPETLVSKSTLGNDPPNPFQNIESFSNKIYFYEEIDKNSIFKLTKLIREMNYKMIASNPEKYLPGNKSDDVIELYIHSYGGSVLSAFAAFDIIRKNPIPINTIIEGGAASAGTILSIAGKKRFIRESSYMLIHQLSSTHWGKYEELKDSMQNSDTLMNRIKNIYKDLSKIPNHELEEILKHDLWLDSKKCLDWGLVDEII